MDILNKKVSNKVVVLVVSIIILIVVSVSTTYSLIYNTKKLSNNTYNTGILDISYSEGETLELNNYIPMDDIQGSDTKPYVITITNTGTVPFQFNLSILSTVEDVTNIIDAKYVKIQIDDKKPVSLSELENGILYSNIILDSGKNLEIKIRLWLDEKTPNTEIGHIYSAKLVATGLATINENSINSTSEGYQTLTKIGLDKYAKLSKEDGILEKVEKDTYSYYFKGNIDYNYVLLNNKYYRIIRIDENGNIRIIYAGTKAHENGYDDSKDKDTIVSENSYNNLANDEMFTGYTYIDNENGTKVDSVVKKEVEKWYEQNIKDTDIEKNIEEAIYCNDRTKENTNSNIYESYKRINNKKETSFVCPVADSYTKNLTLGNTFLKYSVGLPTADELLLIGNDYISNNISFWTMTPSSFTNSESYVFSYNNKLSQNKVTDLLGIRPVLTITPKNLIGDGTRTNPFTYKK